MAKRNHFTKQDIDFLQSFVELIDKEIEIHKGHCFEVDIDLKEVYIGSKRYDRVSQYFMQHWAEEIADAPINWCVLSLLHEIGHIMTDTEELQDNRQMLDSMYSFMYQMGAITENEYFTSYFDIPAERAATEWGINFYKKNQNLCNAVALHLKV